ncbi:aminoimidazole riboside kinase [Vibrio methylphosphonaticus]|uniref:aminoimidazole riboside kinase n=1 Tax=Vibrio methylphosphonaticus TaxID=2946866 RepID=UPI00202AA523|nr:aminoimidazole riboside kinase [Vibrio methylphosphonaticus]MCL9773777.1 aminoimidazole riboside kinase [Vibrio methylphosphonaticus]
MNRVWLSGDAVVDLIPEGDTSYLKCPGGAPANVAVAITRLGGDSAFFGRVGDDPLGRFMKQVLSDEGVSTEYMILDAQQRTSTVIVDLDAQGERSFTFMVKPSADQFLVQEDIPKFEAKQWLHLCSIALANEPSRSSTMSAMESIKAAGGFVSFDPNLREEVWANPNEIRTVVLKAIEMADVVKFSDDELLYLTNTETLQEGLARIAPLNIPLVLVTQGAKGALLIHQGCQQLISGQKMHPIDTTGAGDAFVGGLLVRLAQSDEWNNIATIMEAVQWGNGCGALATTKKGAMTALPTQCELMAFIH